MKNVLLLVCDALRADRINNYHRNLTPNINKLLKESVNFTNAYTVGPNTPNSYPSIFGGIYPSQGDRLNHIPQYIKVAPEIFLKNGYRTVGHVAGNAWLSKYFGYNRGFSYFNNYLELSSMYDAEALSKNKKSFMNMIERKVPTPVWNLLNYMFRLKDDISIEKKLEKTFAKNIFSSLKNINNFPFFFWSHFMTTHYPTAPQIRKFSRGYNLRKLNYLRTSMSEIIDLYDDCVLTFDWYVGKIIKILKKRKIYEDTVIIITSDHGELLGEHGRRFSHPSRFIYEKNLIKIPLIIKFDKSKIRGPIIQPFSIIGLLRPSLFKYLNLEFDNMNGGNLFRIKERKLEIMKNKYLFLEARDFKDAFTVFTNDIQDPVKYYLVRRDKNSLFYNSIEKKYRLIEGKDKNGNLAKALRRHKIKCNENREKSKIKRKINQLSFNPQSMKKI
jgi:arylsulfatase A-like enzyme